MIKKELLFCLFFLLVAQAFPQQWYPAQVPRGRDINSLVILSPDAIILGGGNERNDSVQSIFVSINQGLSWSLRTDNISSWVKSMAFIDSLNGFGVGFNGKIIKTINGGYTWAFANSPTYTRHFNKIIFIDSLHAFIAGGREKNDSVQTILKSGDGGSTWNIVYDQLGFWLKSIYFIDTLNGFAVGDSGTILKTTNGGSSWVTVSSPIQRDFNAVAFINDTIGYIVGGNSDNDSIRTILQTTDGGDNWSVLKDELNSWLTDIYFLNRDTGYIVGYQAALLKTTNGGWTWIPETVNGTNGDEYFNVVRFFNESFGVIGGRFGKAFIYTNSSIPQAQTIGYTVNDSTRVDMFGRVNTAGYPGQYWFVFSTDSTFVNYGQTYPLDIHSDTLTPVVVNVGGLQPNTIYYYYIIAKTFDGFSSGDTLALFTFKDNLVINTLSATEVGNASARLNAEVDKLPLPVMLSFEYGPTNALGNEVQASPGYITDTSGYHISAEIIGLQPNSLYYFRIKAAAEQGIHFYGQIQQLYTGFPIPNWDFQLWQEDTVELPHNWTLMIDNFERVSGNSGDFALKLFKDNIAFLGKILPEGAQALLHDGMPFNARPDSFSGYFNYYVEPGDTAYVLLQLTNNGAMVSLQLCPIAGNSGGNFERLSFKMNYNSPLVPDSLAMGIVTLNPFDTIEVDYSNNFLIVDEIMFVPSAPSILNMGFENWLEYPHKNLESWSYLKFAYIDNIMRGDLPMVTQAFFEEPSDYAAEIRNIKAGNNTFNAGSISLQKHKAIFDEGGPSFPVFAKHQTLNGYLQFYPVNGDTMEISVEMYNQGILVGNGSFFEVDSVTSFKPFSIPINYSSAVAPDSGSVEIGMYTEKGQSRIVIDKLTFDGFVLPNNIESNVSFFSTTGEGIKVYPNPAKNRFIVELAIVPDEEVSLQLIDISGRLIQEISAQASQQKIEINTTDLQPGFFILRVKSGYKVFNKKIVVVN